MVGDSYSLSGWEIPNRLKGCKSLRGQPVLRDSGRPPRVERETSRPPGITAARATPQRLRHAELPNCMKFFEHSAKVPAERLWKIGTLLCCSRQCWCTAALGLNHWASWSPFSQLCPIDPPLQHIR